MMTRDQALDLVGELLDVGIARQAIAFDLPILEAGDRLEDLAAVRTAVRVELVVWRYEILAQLRAALLAGPDTVH